MCWLTARIDKKSLALMPHRTCGFTWREYMCASEEEIESEREWLANRPAVRKRNQEQAILTEKEEERLKVQ